jgi:gliding motility-associated-like protein
LRNGVNAFNPYLQPYPPSNDYILRTLLILLLQTNFNFGITHQPKNEVFAYKQILTITTLILCANELLGQNEFLTTLNYNTIQVSKIGNAIPGVTWVIGGSSAYDANHQRFFFQGNATKGPPWYLFTIDAASGAVLSNPSVKLNTANGGVLGLQYDNGADSLYCLYTDPTGSSYFAWIDPLTGILHPKQQIPNFLAPTGTTYDQNDGWYIYCTATTIITLDARTGSTIYQANLPSGMQLWQPVYDNVASRLYGLLQANAQPLTLSWFSLSSGTANPIAAIAVSGLPQMYAYTIDETAGKYICVGSTVKATGCADYTLYIFDLASGAMVNSLIYPYNDEPENPLDSNLIEYSFDNRRGTLYALNWHPTLATIPPIVSIAASSNPTCSNTPERFTATLSASLSSNLYQWQINSANVGNSGPVFTASNLTNGDTIRCIYTGSTTCRSTLVDTSNSIVLTVADTASVSATISSRSDTICAGDTMTLTAAVVNGGSAPSYQWAVNGVAAGSDNPTFSISTLTNGDTISCFVTGSIGCISPARSNLIAPTVIANPPTAASVTSSATNICSGDTVFFSATPVNGGTSPAYQWLVNGNTVASGGGDFATGSLSNGDVVSCLLQSSVYCSRPTLSIDSITMTVRPTPIIKMTADTTIPRGHSIRLDPAITGAIAQYQWTPATELSDPAIPDPTASPISSITYELTAAGEDGCNASGKIAITVFDPVLLPNAFSPNGDGQNDIFRIPPPVTFQLFNFSIYNRWGQRVFNTTNPGEGWDGTARGTPQPPGTYVWEIEYENPVVKKTMVTKGTVILIR